MVVGELTANSFFLFSNFYGHEGDEESGDNCRKRIEFGFPGGITSLRVGLLNMGLDLLNCGIISLRVGLFSHPIFFVAAPKPAPQAIAFFFKSDL